MVCWLDSITSEACFTFTKAVNNYNEHHSDSTAAA